MKYLCILEHNRIVAHEAIYTFSPLDAGTTIQWGSDDQAPDGLASWTVVSCTPVAE